MRKILFIPCVIALVIIGFAPMLRTARATPAVNPLPTVNLLNILWRTKAGGDYLATTNERERNTYTSDGAIYYIPEYNIAGTVPFYRFHNATDHMESLNPTESGYTSEGPLGYGYSSGSAVPGLAQLERYRKGSGDRALGRPNESAFFSGLGYSLEVAHAAYAYPRYNHQGASLLSLSAGGVTISSNGVAGGSLWTWTWTGSTYPNILNTEDYGREVQAAMFYHDGSNYYNPTEAGNEFSSAIAINDAQDRHGSPLLEMVNNGNMQSTRSVPLEFMPDRPFFGGGGMDHPVIYSNMLAMGKDITLNYHGLGGVARYDTWWNLPGTLGVPTLTSAMEPMVEVPTAYLRAVFNTFWEYNATTNSLIQVQPGGCSGTQGIKYPYPLGSTFYGGVIISDQSGANALGIYDKSIDVGGSTSYFELFDLRCQAGGGTGSGDYNSTKLGAVYAPTEIMAGYYKLTTWLVSGSLSSVVTAMHNLYLTPPGSPQSAASDNSSQSFPYTQVGDGQPGVTTTSANSK